MSPHNQESREKAISYLRGRGIHILDGKFRPTDAPSTNVAETIRRYRQQVENLKPKLVKMRK
jgi:hypothetical protein